MKISDLKRRLNIRHHTIVSDVCSPASRRKQCAGAMKRTLIIIFCTTAIVLDTSVAAEGNRLTNETSSEATSNHKQGDKRETHESVEIVIEPSVNKRDKDRGVDIEIRIDTEQYLQKSENHNSALKPGRPGLLRSPGRPRKR